MKAMFYKRGFSIFRRFHYSHQAFKLAILLSFTQLPHNVTAKNNLGLFTGRNFAEHAWCSPAPHCLTFIELHKFTLRAHYNQSSVVGPHEKLDETGC